MREAFVEPEAGARDPVHEDLQRLGTPVDDVLPRDDHARHVVGPVLAGLEEHAPEAAQLRLRRVRLAHRERVDRAGRERARDVRRRHLDHPDRCRRDSMRRERFEDDQPLVGEAARNRDDVAGKVLDRADRSVLAHDHRAPVAVSEVNDLDRRSLRGERDRHRRDHEAHLHPVGDQSFLDLGEALEHPGDEDVPVERVPGDEIGHRARQVAGHRDVGDVQFALRQRQSGVQEARPVDVQREVGGRERDGPDRDGEHDPARPGDRRATGH